METLWHPQKHNPTCLDLVLWLTAQGSTSAHHKPHRIFSSNLSHFDHGTATQNSARYAHGTETLSPARVKCASLANVIASIKSWISWKTVFGKKKTRGCRHCGRHCTVTMQAKPRALATSWIFPDHLQILSCLQSACQRQESLGKQTHIKDTVKAPFFPVCKAWWGR